MTFVSVAMTYGITGCSGIWYAVSAALHMLQSYEKGKSAFMTSDDRYAVNLPLRANQASIVPVPGSAVKFEPVELLDITISFDSENRLIVSGTSSSHDVLPQSFALKCTSKDDGWCVRISKCVRNGRDSGTKVTAVTSNVQLTQGEIHPTDSTTTVFVILRDFGGHHVKPHRTPIVFHHAALTSLTMVEVNAKDVGVPGATHFMTVTDTYAKAKEWVDKITDLGPLLSVAASAAVGFPLLLARLRLRPTRHDAKT